MSSLGVEYGCKYTLTGPDGTVVVFNDSTDPNFVGILSPESSGLDSPDVREDSTDATEEDGGHHGDFFYGPRPVVLQGTINAASPTQRNERATKLQQASNALRADATLKWKPAGATEEVKLKLRRQQPFRMTKAYVKDFMIPMVSADAYIRGVESHAQAVVLNGLVPLSPATISVGNEPRAIAVSSDGISVYSVEKSIGELRQFGRAPNGELTPLSPATLVVGEEPNDVVVSPDGKSVYSTDQASKTIRQFGRNIVTGKLTPLSPATLTVGTTPSCIIVSADSKSVYSTDNSSGTLRQFERNTSTGKLTPLSPSTLTAGTGPYDVDISPDGKSVYSTDFGGGTIQQFERDTGTGKLVPLSPATLTVGLGPLGIIVSPNGKSVYSTDGLDKTIRQFERDTSTGKLTPLSPATLTVGEEPLGIVVSSDGKSVYSTDGKFTATTIRQFERNTSTGKLAPLLPATVTAGLGPFGIAISPDGKYVYSTDRQSKTIHQFSRKNPTLINGGNSSAFPVVKLSVTSSSSIFKLENKTTGKYILLEGVELTAGEYFIIDFKNHTILKNGTAYAYNALIFAASEWWKLEPGENVIDVTGGSAEFSWQYTYL